MSWLFINRVSFCLCLERVTEHSSVLVALNVVLAAPSLSQMGWAWASIMKANIAHLSAMLTIIVFPHCLELSGDSKKCML